MLHSYVAVGVEVCVSIAEVSEDHELCGDQDDFDELQDELPGGLPSRNEFLDRVHEKERHLPSQKFLVTLLQ